METLIPNNKVKIDPGNAIWKPYFLGTRSKLNITQALQFGNTSSQEQGQIELDPGNAIWKPYFPGTRSKLSITYGHCYMETLIPRNKVKIDTGIPYGNPTSQGQGQN
jgi:hypothetical protein